MLRVENLCKQYPDFLLFNVSFEVEEGDYFILLGKSGAGKSLILEIIAGLEQADSGKIILENKDITLHKIQHREVGILFQDYAVFPHLSVFDNIAYPLKIRNYQKAEIKGQVKKLAETLEILHLLSRSIQGLSGGELQRVALARTLATKPKILLLDEPLSALDAQLRSGIKELLRKLNQMGQTIIHVTHDYEESLMLANKVAVVYNGQIVETGHPVNVFHHPKTQFIAEFTGEKNFFEAELIHNSQEESSTAIIGNSLKIKLLTQQITPHGFILIKKKNILLLPHPIDVNTLNQFEGILTDIILARMGYEVVVDIGVKMVVSITSENQKKNHFKVGQKVFIAFKASCVKFIRA